MINIKAFIRESNLIEGIDRDPTILEFIATQTFLKIRIIDIIDIIDLVRIYQPDAKLRNKIGMDVKVGNHTAPKGGHFIEIELQALLNNINKHRISPYKAHLEYEKLHPFMDGNGRSGRALWLWMMKLRDGAPLGFLHTWYYQSLE